MKRLFTILLCLLTSTIAYADDDRKDVVIDVEKGTSTMPRTVVQKPTVKISAETSTLYVKFLALTESYTLSVEDAQGNIIYQAPLSTTGVEDLHLLGDMESGSYTLRIESGKRTFVGDFDI